MPCLAVFNVVHFYLIKRELVAIIQLFLAVKLQTILMRLNVKSAQIEPPKLLSTQIYWQVDLRRLKADVYFNQTCRLDRFFEFFLS